MHAGEIGLFIDRSVFEAELGYDQARDRHHRDGYPIQESETDSVCFGDLAGKIAESGVLGDVDSQDVVNIFC